MPWPVGDTPKTVLISIGSRPGEKAGGFLGCKHSMIYLGAMQALVFLLCRNYCPFRT